jgi:hypothetical protein
MPHADIAICERSSHVPFWIACIAWSLITLASRPAPAADDADQPPWDPRTAYEEKRIQGWLVLVHQSLALPENESLAHETLELLEDHLYRIRRVVPEPALARLQAVPIWVELAHPLHPCMCYHLSPDWLREHGMNPEKAGAVELANCRNFLAWTHDQPWMVLHELAHAYHHQVLGLDHQGLRECFERASAGGGYDSVLHINGRSQRAYALNNVQEYFAEASEAFFGTNDFFPFVRAELERHDPELYQLLHEVWGTAQKNRPAAPRRADDAATTETEGSQAPPADGATHGS